jgi:AraC-like DNA-binding protein
VSPNALCFEFDQVNPPGLAAMEQALEKYPALPVLMLTVQHAESLAVWSFRVGVWNYLVKPVSVSEFSANLDVLSRICARGGLPLHPKPPDIEEPRDLRSMPVDERVSRLQPALQYVRERFNEKVTEKEAARLCGMQRFAFSRAFHAAFGLTFRAYLMRTRIGEARRLLVEGGHAVTEVCFATGFSDGSYFAAMFKRYTGVLPSHYEKQHKGFPLPRPGAGDGE